MEIKELKTFVNEDGKKVMGFFKIVQTEEQRSNHNLINYTLDSEKVILQGVVGIKTPMGPMPIHFPFPEDYTLEMCFDKFEEIATMEVEKVMQEMQDEQRIAIPGKSTKGNNIII